MNLTRVCVLQALNHNRLNMDASRHRPRRISSRVMAMIIPVLSNGTSCRSAYASADRQPSRASRSFSEKGASWMPLWSTPLLRPLVSSPGCSFRSRTRRRIGAGRGRPMNYLAIAQPTTPAPTMQTSYVFISHHPANRRTHRVQPDTYYGISGPERSQIHRPA